MSSLKALDQDHSSKMYKVFYFFVTAGRGTEPFVADEIATNVLNLQTDSNCYKCYKKNYSTNEAELKIHEGKIHFKLSTETSHTTMENLLRLKSVERVFVAIKDYDNSSFIQNKRLFLNQLMAEVSSEINFLPAKQFLGECLSAESTKHMPSTNPKQSHMSCNSSSNCHLAKKTSSNESSCFMNEAKIDFGAGEEKQKEIKENSTVHEKRRLGIADVKEERDIIEEPKKRKCSERSEVCLSNDSPESYQNKGQAKTDRISDCHGGEQRNIYEANTIFQPCGIQRGIKSTFDASISLSKSNHINQLRLDCEASGKDSDPASVFKEGGDEKALRETNLLSTCKIKQPRTFRMSIKSSGKARKWLDIKRLSRDVAWRVARASGWTVELRNPDIEVCIHINDERVTIGVPLTRFPLSRRDYIADSGLRAPIAWIMAQLACIKSHQRVLDPMCGKGTLLLEAASCTQITQFWGLDRCQSQIDTASLNVEKSGMKDKIHLAFGDCRGTPFVNGVFDEVVCDAPFNQNHLTEGNPEKFYLDFLTEMHRVLASSGRLVLLTSQEFYAMLKPHLMQETHSAKPVIKSSGSGVDTVNNETELNQVFPPTIKLQSPETRYRQPNLIHETESSKPSSRSLISSTEFAGYGKPANISSNIENNEHRCLGQASVTELVHRDSDKGPSNCSNSSSTDSQNCDTGTECLEKCSKSNPCQWETGSNKMLTNESEHLENRAAEFSEKCSHYMISHQGIGTEFKKPFSHSRNQPQYIGHERVSKFSNVKDTSKGIGTEFKNTLLTNSIETNVESSVMKKFSFSLLESHNVQLGETQATIMVMQKL